MAVTVFRSRSCCNHVPTRQKVANSLEGSLAGLPLLHYVPTLLRSKESGTYESWRNPQIPEQLVKQRTNFHSNKISFDTRTKTVMADVAQVNIKEKVSAVREVVSGKSNNEIVLVLQYYDNDVERVIQAFLEDGAKEALTEWHTSGSKPVKKKRNKKKPQTRPDPTENSHSPVSVSSESESTTSLLMNGHGREQTNNHTTHVSADDHKEPLLLNGRLSPVQAVVSESPDTIIDPVVSHPHVPTLSDTPDVPTMSADTHVKKEKSPSPLQQRQHQDKRNHHSGSHSNNRTRTTNNSSTGADNRKNGKKLPHHVLERSAKDLHRQTVSLERLRLVFSDEVDKSYKRIKTVFDEIRNCLNKREEELLGEMNSVKLMGRDTFTMRQGLAADLKVKIDRAEKMNESELAELRSEIKHFVSDRKIDEDLGRTTRFLYADDSLKADLAKFGEVVPVKCVYIQRHPSLSSLDSGAPSEHDPISPPQTNNHKGKDESKKNTTIPHLDSTQTHEIAELQKRLKHSLTLEGIPVEHYPDRPVSMPLPETSSTISTTNNRGQHSGSSRGGRGQRGGGPANTGRRADRNDKTGPNYNRGFIQGADGERIILIGKGTRPQSGPGRPSRGRGRGDRGRGGYRNEGRQGPRNPRSSSSDETNNQVHNINTDSPGGGKDGKPQRPRREPRKPREKSGSPRKSGGNVKSGEGDRGSPRKSGGNVVKSGEGDGGRAPAGLDGSRSHDTVTAP